MGWHCTKGVPPGSKPEACPEESSIDTPEQLSQVGWTQLAEMPEQEREQALVIRLSKLADLPEDQRRVELGSMVLINGELSVEKVAAFTLSRMRAWLKMDPHKAEVVAASYEAVMATMSADMAWRRIVAIQQALKHLPPEDRDKLHFFFPQEVPKAVTTTTGLSLQKAEPTLAPPGRKSWWPWSKKGGANDR